MSFIIHNQTGRGCKRKKPSMFDYPFLDHRYYDCLAAINMYRVVNNLSSGQQHQQFRALGLGQRPFLDAPTSFRSHLRELESFGRNKHHHHHSSHLHDQQTGNNVTTNSVSGACTNPNNTDPTASPASSTHLGATGGSSTHQDCYKRSPQHGGEF